MKYKWKLHPGDYALGENEKLYSDMHAKGWALETRTAWRSRFVQTEPRSMRYRVEVAEPTVMGKNGYVIPPEQIAVYEDSGCEYVTSRDRLHYFRAPEGSDAPEFYEDPKQQAETLKGVRKKLMVNTAVAAAVVLLMILALLGKGRFIDSRYMLYPSLPALSVFWICLLLQGFSASAVNIVYISRTYRRLKNGIPLDHSPKGRGMLPLVLDNIIRAMCMICLVMILLQVVNMHHHALPKEADGPYIVLSDIGIEGQRTEYLGGSSYAENTRTIGSEWWHTCEYVDRGTGETVVSLYQTVFRSGLLTSSEFWVRRLTASQAFSRDLDDYTPVEIEGLDAAWVSENGMEAMALKGHLIAAIEYLDGEYSTQKLIGILRALAVRWEEFE